MCECYDNSKAGESRRRKAQTREGRGGQAAENNETHYI